MRTPPPVAAPPPHDPGDLHLPVDLLAVLGAQELKRLPALGAAPLAGLHIDDPFLGLQMRIDPAARDQARPAAVPAYPRRRADRRQPGRSSVRASRPSPTTSRTATRSASSRSPAACPPARPAQPPARSARPFRPQRGGRGLQLRDPRLGPPGAGTPVTDISILIDHRHGTHRPSTHHHNSHVTHQTRRVATQARPRPTGSPITPSGDWDSGNPTFALSRGSPSAPPLASGHGHWFSAMLFSLTVLSDSGWRQIQRYLLSSLPAARAIQQCASWRTLGSNRASHSGSSALRTRA